MLSTCSKMLSHLGVLAVQVKPDWLSTYHYDKSFQSLACKQLLECTRERATALTSLPLTLGFDIRLRTVVY